MDNIAQYYAVLSVDSAASLETIKYAYRELAKIWHPDKYAGNSELKFQAEVQMKKINQAYSAIESYLELKNNISGQIDDCRSPVSIKKNTPDFYYFQGVEYAEQQNYPDALASFGQAIQLNPECIKAYQYRGFILSKLGYENRASAEFDKANRIKAKNKNRIFDRTITTTERPITSIAICSDIWICAYVNNDREIKLRNISTGKVVGNLRGHTDVVNSLIIDYKGTTLISAGKDKNIRFWDLKKKKIVKTFRSYFNGHSKSVLALALSPDNKILLSYGADNIINTWNINRAKIVNSISVPANLNCLQISPNCKLFSYGSLESRLNIRQISDGTIMRSIDNNSGILCMAFSPNNNILATGGVDRLIRLWEISTGNIIYTLSGHSERLSNLAFTSDSKNLISTSCDSAIKVWQLQTGKEIASVEANSNKIRAIAVEIAHNRQTLISGDNQGKIKIWNCFF